MVGSCHCSDEGGTDPFCWETKDRTDRTDRIPVCKLWQVLWFPDNILRAKPAWSAAVSDGVCFDPLGKGGHKEASFPALSTDLIFKKKEGLEKTDWWTWQWMNERMNVQWAKCEHRESKIWKGRVGINLPLNQFLEIKIHYFKSLCYKDIITASQVWELIMAKQAS